MALLWPYPLIFFSMRIFPPTYTIPPPFPQPLNGIVSGKEDETKKILERANINFLP